jgi:hypothetical protein
VIVGTALASIGLFVGALGWLGVVEVAAGALTTSRGAMAAMSDERLTDRGREAALQRASLRLFADAASLVVRVGLAAAAAFVPVGLAAAAGLASVDSVVAFLSGWEAAVMATAVTAGAYGFRTTWWRNN